MLFAALLLCAAPVPAPPPLAADDLAGTWACEYGEARGTYTFLPGGTYAARFGGSYYDGRWWVDARGRLVTTEDRWGHHDGTRYVTHDLVKALEWTPARGGGHRFTVRVLGNDSAKSTPATLTRLTPPAPAP